jgi:hypothetical protein
MSLTNNDYLSVSSSTNECIRRYTNDDNEFKSDINESINIHSNIVQPASINVPLFLHQLKSIEDMDNLEREKEVILNTTIYINTKLGVLADLPGYGKSLSMLGLISLSSERDKERYKETDNIQVSLEKIKYHDYVSVVKTNILTKVNCSVILVNVSLMSQWVSELNRTLLNYIAIHKTTEIEDIELSKYDVILVSSNVYNVFSQVYRKKCWKRFIIDEPSSLKMSMDETYSEFYWLITGTPNELYLKRIIGFLNELLPSDIDTFNHLIIKNDDNVVKSSYNMPITRNMYYKCKGCISSLFEGIVPDNVLEMIQAVNIGGIFNSFGIEKKDSDEIITIYDAYKIRKNKRLEELNLDRTKKIEKIEMIETHINLLDDRILRYVIQNTCIVCNNSYKEAYVLSCCQQIYCGCLNNLLDTCPLCKSREYINIKIETKDAMSCSLEDNNQDIESKTKIDKMLEIIGDGKNKKILIFSNYNETFNIIKKFLEENKLIYLELRGTKEKRDNVIDSYKSGHVNILLLNTIQSGAGLNLQETSDIILFHKIHEYQKIQVIGRANRIGRKIELNVHYLE